MKLYPVASFAVIDTRDDDVTRTGFIVHIVCYKCVSYSKEMYKKNEFENETRGSCCAQSKGCESALK